MPALPILNCDGCGKCCQNIGFPPFMYFEILNLPADLNSQIMPLYDNRQSLEMARVKCVWLSDDNKCMHYEHRPKVCRDFTIGEPACLWFRNEST